MVAEAKKAPVKFDSQIMEGVMVMSGSRPIHYCPCCGALVRNAAEEGEQCGKCELQATFVRARQIIRGHRFPLSSRRRRW